MFFNYKLTPINTRVFSHKVVMWNEIMRKITSKVQKSNTYKQFILGEYENFKSIIRTYKCDFKHIYVRIIVILNTFMYEFM